MKFRVMQSNFLGALKAAERATASRPVVPVTSHILLSVGGDGIVLAATDLTLTLTTWLRAEVLAEGSCAVPVALVPFIDSLPEGVVELELTLGALRVTQGRTRARFPVLPRDDFPEPQPQPDGVVLTLSGTRLRGALGRVSTAAAGKADPRPALRCIETTLTDGRLTFAATDGVVLACESIKVDGAWCVRALVPAAAIAELMRLLTAASVTLNLGEHALYAATGSTSIQVQCHNGVFPLYEPAIPKTFTTRVTIDASVLHAAVERILLVARQDKSVVRIVAIPGEPLGLRGGSPGTDSEMDDALDCQIDGDGGMVALDGSYLASQLAGLTGPVSFSFNQPTTPVRLFAGELPEWTAVLSPMRVSWVEPKKAEEPVPSAVRGSVNVTA